MDLSWVQNIMVILPTIVAIGWCIEKALRLVNTLLPESVTIDDDIAEFLARMLKLVGSLLKKKVD